MTDSPWVPQDEASHRLKRGSWAAWCTCGVTYDTSNLLARLLRWPLIRWVHRQHVRAMTRGIR